MSGHNKWSSIKHRKGAQDAKRSKVFSRIAKMLIVAAQQGGGDPETNNSLKMLIDQARKANMPKDNVERAIKRGTGESGEDVRIEEVVYEAMGPEGTMFMIVCATDNTNRTLTDVKTALKKNNGKFVPSGSVSFQFQHVGEIIVIPKDMDVVELAAIDAGAQDVERDDDALMITTALTDFHTVRDALSKICDVEEARIIYKPTQTVTLSPNGQSTYDTLYEALEDLDDVQDIFDNVA